ncbi:hypothetical protein [Sporisorium scitamineum]|uniref:Uncharacterized protein n=1 Tax=Sporisorium scitamineum TaxID=49012 RepID=A0A0F7S3H8_9BASI|nr:hypothetical protein [Sporisorium scitamineum]
MDSKAIHTLQYLQPHRFFGDRLSQIPLMNQTWTSAVSGFNRSSGRLKLAITLSSSA